MCFQLIDQNSRGFGTSRAGWNVPPAPRTYSKEEDDGDTEDTPDFADAFTIGQSINSIEDLINLGSDEFLNWLINSEALEQQFWVNHVEDDESEQEDDA